MVKNKKNIRSKRVKRKRTKRTKRTTKRSLKRNISKRIKSKKKNNRKKKKTKRMKGGMDDQRLGVAASAAPTELQDLMPIGEELKEIVLTRKPGDSYESRLENKTQFFDKARELLQSVTTTMTINY